MDVNSYDELGELAKNGEVINLMANCGETSVLQATSDSFSTFLHYQTFNFCLSSC